MSGRRPAGVASPHFEAMRSHGKWLICILAAAMVLRIGAAVVLQNQLDDRWQRQFLIPGDADGYWTLAQRTADGESYEIYTPPRRVLRMPGFPSFLALHIRLFGQRMLATRMSLCFVGTLAVGLVYWLGCELAGTNTGLIASALAAVSPVMIGFTPLILSETLFATCLLASLVAMAKLARRESSGEETAPHHAPGGEDSGRKRTAGICIDRQSLVLAVASGGLIAAACYVRPSWLLAGAALRGVSDDDLAAEAPLTSDWRRRLAHNLGSVAAVGTPQSERDRTFRPHDALGRPQPV